jgi:hypothetical protein
MRPATADACTIGISITLKTGLALLPQDQRIIFAGAAPWLLRNSALKANSSVEWRWWRTAGP